MDNNSLEAIKSIGGREFGAMVLSASAAIEKNKKVLNELNVFPVPDGDTGTNMAMTIKAAAASLSSSQSGESISEVSAQIASALLRGARGNSGVIMSLLFRGMSKKMKSHAVADAKLFAEAMKAGVEAAYSAVMKPAEGTVLTVSRKAAEAAQSSVDSGNEDIMSLLLAAQAAAEKSLAETPLLNPVLAKAKVVDAGGKGYCCILEGFMSALRGEEAEYLEEEAAENTESASPFDAFETEDIRFAYCTEFIVMRSNEEKSPLALRAFLETIGDCVVVVDDEEIIKVHVHSNNPGKVIEEALTYGALTKIKIENMKEQHSEQLISGAPSKPSVPSTSGELPSAEPTGKYGFVSVASGEGICEVFRALGADRIVEGGQTMNPSTADIVAEIVKTDAKTVFVLPNNKNIELAARQTVALVTNKRVIVLGTHTIPQGIAAMLAFDAELYADDNVAKMTAAMKNVSSGSITYAVRDSVYAGNDIKEGDILALCNGKVCGAEKSMANAVNAVFDAMQRSSAELITVFTGADAKKEDDEALEKAIAARFPDAEVNMVEGNQPVYYYIIGVE